MISRRTFLTTLGLATLAGESPSHASTVGTPETFALHGTMYTGRNSEPLNHHALIVHGTDIHAIIPSCEATDIPNLAPPDSTIFPGVINAHVHGIHSAEERRQRYLSHGVTSIGDAASPLSALHTLRQNRPDQTATAACAGPMLCPPGGYPLTVHGPQHGLVVNSPVHGKERVKMLADAGATLIKMAFEPGPYTKPWPLLPQATAASICEEAQRLGLRVRCHVEDFGGLKKALQAGVDVIDHVPHRWIHLDGPRPVLTPDNRTPIKPYCQLLEQMVRDKIVMVPTLDVLSRSIWNGPELFVPVSTFAHMGGMIALGNDFPYRRTDAGMPTREMALLRQAGLTSQDVLTAATYGSAQACGFSDRGLLQKGMKADILISTHRSRPVHELLQAPSHVIKHGTLIL